MKGDGFASGGTGCSYIDFCRDEEFPHECNEHATCVYLDRGQYDCVCAEGFAKVGQGRGSDGCVNVNECEDFKTNDCHIGSSCIDLIPSESNGFQKCVSLCSECECYRNNNNNNDTDTNVSVRKVRDGSIILLLNVLHMVMLDVSTQGLRKHF